MEQKEIKPKLLIEAILFASGRALSINEISEATGIASVGQIAKILKELEEEYGRENTSIKITKLADKYVMELKENYAKMASKFSGNPSLSKGALRILAYISKNEPVMQSRIVKAFGQSTYAYIKELTDKEFIKATRNGRTKNLATTQKFSEYFNLK